MPPSLANAWWWWGYRVLWERSFLFQNCSVIFVLYSGYIILQYPINLLSAHAAQQTNKTKQCRIFDLGMYRARCVTVSYKITRLQCN